VSSAGNGGQSSARCARSARANEGYADRVAAIARLLAALGERLEPGDRLITGSIVQVPVAAGDLVAADLGLLGRVEVMVR
jgi:2-keto-4-pentenoate hydratase